MSRGMTLLEMLVSLALLSALSAASLGWTRITRDLARVAQPIAWHAAAERILQQIGDDLMSGDFSPGDEDPENPRILTTAQGALQIRTRSRSMFSSGAITREFSRRDQILVVRELTDERVLLDRVASWQCTIEERDRGQANAKETWLTVAIAAADGSVAMRSFFLGVIAEERR